jgi:glycerol kinase
LFKVPKACLPEVRPSAGSFGAVAARGWPITGVLGDQQSALFGHGGTAVGDSKCTYGTGAFWLTNAGTEMPAPQQGLLTTVAWQLDGALTYAVEGSVLVAGALVQWLRDGLGIIERSADVEALAASVPDSGGVVCVPAFTGLGAPYWQADARGALLGLSRGSTRAHVARAAVESIAFQSASLLQAMQADAAEMGAPALAELRVDGGASVNDALMQFQADLLGVPVLRPRCVETTAFGSATLAGLATGVYADRAEIAALWQAERRFEPRMSRDEAAARMATWDRAVRQVTAA